MKFSAALLLCTAPMVFGITSFAPRKDQPCIENWEITMRDICDDFPAFESKMNKRLQTDRRPICKARKAAEELLAFAGWVATPGVTFKDRVDRLCQKYKDEYGFDEYRHVEFQVAASRSTVSSKGDDRCLRDVDLKLKEGCNYFSVLDAIEAKMKLVPDCAGRTGVSELGAILALDPKRGSIERQAIDAIDDICVEAYDKRGYLDLETVHGENKIFSKAFFDGGTRYNDERPTEHRFQAHKVEQARTTDPGGRLKAVGDKLAGEQAMWWPYDMSNFGMCRTRAVMCCWVQDRQAGDKKGDCEAPYDQNCADADPDDNTDVCYHDLSTAPSTSRVQRGVTFFPGDNKQGEGNAYCHGFAWSQDVLHPSSVFRGNSLFMMSMYDDLQRKGYVKSIPGAPMCGCLEQMPVVTRADCTEVKMASQDGSFKLKNGQISARVGKAKLTYQPCKGLGKNNDLYDHFAKMVRNGDADESELKFVRNNLVGDGKCELETSKFMARRFDNAINEDTGYKSTVSFHNT